MKEMIVLLRFVVLVMVLLAVSPGADCYAQKNASRKAEKEMFGKHRKSKPFSDDARPKGAAGKAMKEQEKKEAQREKEGAKTDSELKAKHYNMQSTATQERMKNNEKATAEKYKAKKQKQHKEQKKPKKRYKRKP